MTEEMTDEARANMLKQRLEEGLRAARQELDEIEERLQDKGDYSPGNGDPLVGRRELDLALKSRVQNRIEELEEALERLDEGTYGVCSRCGRPEERQRLESEIEDLQEEPQKVVRQLPRWQREVQEKLRAMNREMAELAVGGLFGELREKYDGYPKVLAHLDDVQEDVVENARDLI